MNINAIRYILLFNSTSTVAKCMALFHALHSIIQIQMVPPLSEFISRDMASFIKVQ